MPLARCFSFTISRMTLESKNLLCSGYQGPFVWRQSGQGINVATYCHLTLRPQMHGALLQKPPVHLCDIVLGPADCLTLNDFTTLIILHRYREENMMPYEWIQCRSHSELP
jgi:hypothetical protein